MKVKRAIQTGLKLQVKYTAVIWEALRKIFLSKYIPVDPFVKDNSISRTCAPLKPFVVHVKEVPVVLLC